MPELLIELFSEEIPARMQARAADDLKRLTVKALADAGLEHGEARAFATPRRLALVIDGLATAQPDISEERRGPRVDAPEKAIEGFLRAAGINREDAVERDEKKGTFLYAVIEKKGGPTASVVAKALAEIIRGFPWPKSQRWGEGKLKWVRPLHSILCLFDGAVVNLDVDGIASGCETRGHRFLGPDPFTVKSFADYEAKLKAAHVILDPAARKGIILDRARELAAGAGLDLIEDNRLADEVAGLVEWPVPLIGSFDPAFMEIPAECLISEMREHQKYFALRDPKTGNLAPKFILVSNMVAADGGKAITGGNERVLSARLSDAKFFWDKDLETPLEDRTSQLNDIVFHVKLGTVADKVARMKALMATLVPAIPGCDLASAERAASLAKADLVSGMVYEFPDLQGAMGRYYALRQGEDAAVADAIRDHYSPLGPSDDCPSAPVSVAVALADKIDSLAGFFAIDERPTGSKDPFALRRAALGVIRLITENGLRLNLLDIIEAAAAAHLDQGHVTTATAPGLAEFFTDRLKAQQRDKGTRHDLIDAVFALGGENDLVRLLARVAALGAFLDSDDGTNLLAGYKRAANILRIEEKRDGAAHTGDVDPARLTATAEIALAKALDGAQAGATTAIENEDFAGAMRALAGLRAPIDAFFDNVTVNADDKDLRANRLNLLNDIRTSVHHVADFSRIEG